MSKENLDPVSNLEDFGGFDPKLAEDIDIFEDLDPDELELVLSQQAKEDVRADLSELSEKELWNLYSNSDEDKQAEIRRVIAQKKGLSSTKKALRRK